MFVDEYDNEPDYLNEVYEGWTEELRSIETMLMDVAFYDDYFIDYH